jgi:chromate transporter
MILLDLFLTFFRIGLFTFGGGYAMISLIREEMLANSWLSDGELLNMIAVAESTPGPIAVNMATFVGSKMAGVPGALLATLGVVLPSFLIILLISALIGNILRYRGVQAFLSGVRPCVVALILSTAITMLISNLFGFANIKTPHGHIDLPGLLLLVLLFFVAFVYQRLTKKKPSPILMILLSAGLGILFYP